MDEKIQSLLHALERAPQWLRNELASKDAGVRSSAEETMATMIANALDGGTGHSTKD
ncbi:hypothetical protein HHL26_19615 [Sphingobium sp. TB-6]|uniref:DUF6771 family protein n=1 Tax=Sphingobium sp. TB-6 TaxID=2728850 RepID=UPI00146BB027|nr:DUF6771 family protein [Sphingobium sp. TB-6]NML91251.1 hypothetical protein [Sphingobium sp. TB-6]